MFVWNLNYEFWKSKFSFFKKISPKNGAVLLLFIKKNCTGDQTVNKILCKDLTMLRIIFIFCCQLLFIRNIVYSVRQALTPEQKAERAESRRVSSNNHSYSWCINGFKYQNEKRDWNEKIFYCYYYCYFFKTKIF
jgi:hypothetical protein